ncbi:MAG TPA: L-serine ammonia-lyase, iron-sulfur-dependent, subunit alpha [Gemmatimonadota bacterium]|nr:L-serine ammonia-lyase, iron-sulfur-dependent, subunit alpha [Gemmatimonadota bacterium]
MYRSINDWFEAASSADIDLPTAVLRVEIKETGVSEERIRARIAEALGVMRQAVAEGLESDEPSPSGLTGGRARRLVADGPRLLGPRFTDVLARAIATLEVNARMGLIMAAPTAGAAGVVPAVLLALADERGWTEAQLVDAMLVAGGVGAVIAERASIAGAGGGCQAETGSAAAMSAGAVTWLEGGTPEQVGTAVALTLQGMLGLICDPIAGLVEIPCAYRNATGAVNAIAAAEMALAGLDFPVPVDQVIDVMGEVGRKMDVRYRETALGGLAATPAGQEIAERAGMHELVQLQRKGRTEGEETKRFGPS